MLKIGEFSALSQVSIKTLRYYDEVGLFRPVEIDRESGYRYYSVSQLTQLHRILALKDLGLSLERIARVLSEGISADALRGMLLMRKVEQEDRVHEETETLNRVNARLRLIELDGKMTIDVVLKQLPQQWIVSLRDSIPEYRAIGGLIGKLFGLLSPLRCEGTGLVLVHDEEFKDQDIDAEAGVCLKELIKAPEPLRVYQLAAANVASAIHHGPFNRVGEAYDTLLRWIEANGYHKAGPTRELFLHISIPVTREDPSNITEIQVPVEKT